MSLTDAPGANRLHISLYGKRDSGKSSLINGITGQHIALVSNVPGKHYRSGFKSNGNSGNGSCLLIDTAGFDDDNFRDLGEMRVEKTKQSLEKTDIAHAAV